MTSLLIYKACISWFIWTKCMCNKYTYVCQINKDSVISPSLAQFALSKYHWIIKVQFVLLWKCLYLCVHYELGREKFYQQIYNILLMYCYETCINFHLDGSSCIYGRMWKGLPRSIVLRPLLFNIYTYVLEAFLRGSVNILQ